MDEQDKMLDELKSFKPEPLTVKRLKELAEHAKMMDELARDGQFGFQILMMHPEGHIQMVYDIMELTKYWLEACDTCERVEV